MCPAMDFFKTMQTFCLFQALTDVCVSDQAKQCSFFVATPSCIKFLKSFLPPEKKKEEMALKFDSL